MKNMKAIVTVGCLGVVLFSAAQSAPAQSDAPLPDAVYIQSDVPAGEIESEPPAIVEFGPPDVVGFGMRRHDRVVTNAPFSAQTALETSQVLADGTHIERTTTGTVYRDSQGRTRREETLPPFGPFAAGGKAPQVVLLHDPVAGVHFLLEPDRKVARKMAIPPHGGVSGGVATLAKPPAPVNSANETTESLGTETIEGVSTTGTRVTRTIPVGQIGNDRPLQIVMERWYSSDLQMNVLTKRSDPRMGTTTYRVTNINRSEPAPALFEVPSDYTVREGGPGHAWIKDRPRP